MFIRMLFLYLKMNNLVDLAKFPSQQKLMISKYSNKYMKSQ